MSIKPAFVNEKNEIQILDAEKALRIAQMPIKPMPNTVWALQNRVRDLEKENAILVAHIAELEQKMVDLDSRVTAEANNIYFEGAVDDQNNDVQVDKDELASLRRRIIELEEILSNKDGNSSFKTVSLSSLINEERDKTDSSAKLAIFKKIIEDNKTLRED